MAIIREGDPGTRSNPINDCPDMRTAKGECRLIVLTYPGWPDNKQYRYTYFPTEEEKVSHPIRDFLMGIEAPLFDFVFGLFNTAIEKATGGVITEYLGDETTLENLLTKVGKNLGEKAIELTTQATSQITGLVTGAMNESAAAMSQFLGVGRAQEAIADSLQEWIDSKLNIERLRADRTAQREEEAAKAFSESVIHSLAEKQEANLALSSQVVGWFSAQADRDSDLFFETSLAGLDIIRRTLDIDLTALAETAETKSIKATATMATIADEIVTRETEWLMNTIVVPIANAEGTAWAIDQASLSTQDEVMDGMVVQLYTELKLAQDIIDSGLPAIEYLEKRGE